MKEHAEAEIKLGLKRSPGNVVDEIERTAEKMAAKNWQLVRTVTDELLGSILMFFERDIPDREIEGDNT